MFAKKTGSSKIDPEQRELIEKAQARTRQKRRLYQHFIFFLIGSVILILINVFFNYGQNIKPFGLDWFVWVIIFWALILLFHVYNVYVTHKFLGKDWENRQIEKLVEKQKNRIDKLQQKVERDYPLPNKDPLLDPKKPINPDSPFNT